MTGRAMPEGDLRTVIATSIREGAQSWNEANAAAGHAVAPYSDYVADAVLAVIRPNLGPGMTDDQRAMMTTALNGIERAVTEFEGAEQRRWVAEYVSVLRAIVGRGEVGTAEGGNDEPNRASGKLRGLLQTESDSDGR